MNAISDWKTIARLTLNDQFGNFKMKVYMFMVATILALLSGYTPAVRSKVITDTTNHGIIPPCNPNCQSGDVSQQKVACTKCCKEAGYGATHGECYSGPKVYMIFSWGKPPVPKKCYCSTRILVKVDINPSAQCSYNCAEGRGSLASRSFHCGICCAQAVDYFREGICKRTKVSNKVEVICNCKTHTPISSGSTSRNIKASRSNSRNIKASQSNSGQSRNMRRGLF